MSTTEDEDKLSCNVDESELDLLYQDEHCEDGGKRTYQSKSPLRRSRDRDMNEKKVLPKKLPHKPDRPLFRPRQLRIGSRGRGRGFIRGSPRGRGSYHRIDPRRRPGNFKRRDRSRSEEDLRVQLDSLRDRASRSGKRHQSRGEKSGQQYRENKHRSSSRERRDSCDSKRSQSKEIEPKIKHAVQNNKKFESKSGLPSSNDRSRSRSNDSNATNKDTKLKNEKDTDETSRNKYMGTKDTKKMSKSNYDLKNNNSKTKEFDFRIDNRRPVSPEDDSRNRGKRAKSIENNLRGKGRNSRSREVDIKDKSRRSRSQDVDLNSKGSRSESKNNHSKLDKRSESRSRDSSSKSRKSKSYEKGHSNCGSNKVRGRSVSHDGMSRNHDKIDGSPKNKARSVSREKRSQSKQEMCSRSKGRRSASLGRPSCSGGKLSSSRERRSISRSKHSRSRGRSSTSRGRRSASRERCSASKRSHSASRGRRSASRGKHSANRGRRSASRGKHSANRGEQLTSRGRRSASRGRRSVSRGRRSTSRGNRSVSRRRRSTSRGRRSGSRGRRSVSRGRRSVSRGRRSASRGRRSTSRGGPLPSRRRRSGSRRRRSVSRRRRSASRGRRSANRGRQLASRGRRSSSRGRCSGSRTRRSTSRGIRSSSRRRRSTNRGSQSIDRRRYSSSRGRRSLSRGRRSRSRCRRSGSRLRHSRSRSRRSRSRNRRSRSRERSRKSDSRSSTSSRSSSRRSQRTYSRSRSKSSDVIVYKSRIELIDLDKYEENQGRETLAPLSSDPLLTTFNIGQIPVRPQFSETLPVAGNSFVNQQYESQPPLLPEQPSPTPFLSSHIQPGPQPFVGGPPPPQIFTSQPSVVHHTPAVLVQRPLSPVQFHRVPHAQPPEEFVNFQHNLPGEFVHGVHHEHFQPPQASPPPSFKLVPSLHPPEWNAPHQKQQSSFSIYDLEPSPPPAPPPLIVKAASKKSGVEEERQNQKQTLVIQLDQYLQKNAQLQKELGHLKEKRTELLQENLSETEGLLKENTKLQNEITQRLKAVENVIEMLSGLIKKDQPQNKKSDLFSSRKESRKHSPLRSHHSPEVKKCRGDLGRSQDCKRSSKDRDRSPRRNKTPPKRNTLSPHSHDIIDEQEDDAVINLEPSTPPSIFPAFKRARSPLKLNLMEVQKTNTPDDISRTTKSIAIPSTTQNQVNLVHYDPELHWCSLCNVFPKTTVDYLNHLHTAKHKEQAATLKINASPWHSDEPVEPQQPIIKNAPTKRMPIRGVQFLVPTTGWYCRLCKTWIGDMHCAQDHLKSHKHTTNYAEFITQNPHWEVDWLSDRTKSFERSSENLSRLRDKEESPTLNPSSGLESEKAKFSALSDTLLAVLAQQSKRSRQSSSSSSTSFTEGDGRKKHKRTKKKKFKKRKKKDVTPEKTSSKVEKPHVTQYRHRSKDDDGEVFNKSDIISNWMDCEKLGPPIEFKLKNKPQQKFDDSNNSKLLDGMHMNVEVKGDKRSDDVKVGGLFINAHKEGDKMKDKFIDKSKDDGKSSYSGNDKNKLETPRERYSDRSRDGDRPSDRYDERNKGAKSCYRYFDNSKDMNKSMDHSERYRKGYRNNESQNEKNEKDDKSFARSKDSMESSSRRKSARDPLQFIRRELRDSRDLKQNKDQADGRPMTEIVEQAKKRLAATKLEENELKISKKMSSSHVFRRPNSDQESPEPEIPDRKDKFSKNEKPQGKLWFPSSTNCDEDKGEKTTFEKQPEDSFSKMETEVKKVQQFMLQKTKLPFIGKIPILKKRPIEFKCEEPKKKS